MLLSRSLEILTLPRAPAPCSAPSSHTWITVTASWLAALTPSTPALPVVAHVLQCHNIMFIHIQEIRTVTRWAQGNPPKSQNFSCFFLPSFLFSHLLFKCWTYFRFTEDWADSTEFLYAPRPFIASRTVNILYECGTFVTSDELILIHYYWLKYVHRVSSWWCALYASGQVHDVMCPPLQCHTGSFHCPKRSPVVGAFIKKRHPVGQCPRTVPGTHRTLKDVLQ